MGAPPPAPPAQPGEWDGQSASDPPSPHRIQKVEDSIPGSEQGGSLSNPGDRNRGYN